MDGMDALSVKSATTFAKKYVLENGPLMLEMVSPVLTVRPLLHVSRPEPLHTFSRLLAVRAALQRCGCLEYVVK